jgi:hypothetical protein
MRYTNSNIAMRRWFAAGLLCIAMAAFPAVAGDPVAAAAAANGPACSAARPFYWEIGNANGVLASGQVGVVYNRNTRMNLASASKWILGAYAYERYGGVPPAGVHDALRMLSGYKNFNQALCALAPTVKGCFNMIGNNTQVPALVGKFFYSGGNSQYVARDAGLLGLGDYTTAQLTAEIQLTLGTTMEYQYPALSAGLEGSAAEYADFLRRLMKPPASGGLVMHDYLGYDTVPTQPCPSGHSGCAAGGTIDWSYGDHYWVEDNAVAGDLGGGTILGPGDGAYSSAGAWGFYPWISADRQLYGIVARRGLLGTAFRVSTTCGQAIRYAYTGYMP